MADQDASTAERLVLVTLDLLQTEGLEALSLRRVAREAGVSHGAPLRHFPSFAALCAEAAGRGFALLEEAIAKAAAQLPPGSDPVDRLYAASHAYIEQAVAHPGLFTLMFRPERLDTARPAFAVPAAAAFEQLVGHVRAAQDAGFHPGIPTRRLAGALWSAVHGVSMLWSDRALAVPTGEDPERVVEALLALVIPRALSADEASAPAFDPTRPSTRGDLSE